MPVYEFYCSNCHMIFNFFSGRVNTDTRPACPRCGKPGLDRQVSRFAFSSGRPEETEAGAAPDLDDERMERAMLSLAGEMDGVDENDPRQMARFMRKFSDVAGVSFGDGFEDAVRRLESGEDPERIEEEMGSLFDDAGTPEMNPFRGRGIGALRKKYLPPAHDETLYKLEAAPEINAGRNTS